MIQYSNIKAYNQIWSPMGRYPMMDNSIFETYSEALEFATTSSTAVVGNILTVTNDIDKTKNGVYVLTWTPISSEDVLTNSSQPTGLEKIGSDVDLSNYVTKDELTSIYTYKGSVNTYDDLISLENPLVGDVYNVVNAYTIDNKTIAGGTNWVWNGSNWDALAGSIDLSDYALKSTLESSVNTINTELTSINNSVQSLLSVVDTKVSSQEGYSLISEEDLLKISANESKLNAYDSLNISSRLSDLEGYFKDGDLNIDLGDINTTLSQHTSQISDLSAECSKFSTDITSLQSSLEEVNNNISDLNNTVNTNLATAKSYADELKIEIETDYTAADATTLQSAKQYTDEVIANFNFDDSTLVSRVAANETAISNLTANSDVEGSILHTVNTAINDFAEKITDNGTIDTFKELIDYASTHTSEYATLAGIVQINSNSLATLKANDTTEGSIAKMIKDAVSEEVNLRETGDASNLQLILTISNDYLKNSDKEALLAAIDTKVSQSDYDLAISELTQSNENTLTAAKAYVDEAFMWTDVNI